MCYGLHGAWGMDLSWVYISELYLSRRSEHTVPECSQARQEHAISYAYLGTDHTAHL